MFDEHNVISPHASKQIQEMIIGIINIQRLAALEIHVEALQRAVRSQVAQHRMQILVVNETAFFGIMHLRVERRLCVFEQHGDVADETGVAGPDHFEELPDGLEAQLAPVGGPDGAAASALTLEEEFVFGVEDAAAFVVDLSAGAEEGGGALEVFVGRAEVETGR